MVLLQYADRLAIGLESVIRNVSASTVKAFYDKWYRPENMAVIVVGDFQDCEEIVGLVKEKLQGCQAHTQGESPDVPRQALSVFIDRGLNVLQGAVQALVMALERRG